MHQPRILARQEGLLRHPGTGSPNLAAAPNEWHVLAPRYRDERYRISALAMTLAGPGLLASLGSFGGATGTLEVAVDVADGLGGVRNMASVTAHLIDSVREWRGTHLSTFVDREAGRYQDGTERAGLRGLPVAGAAPAPAEWVSAPIPLRHGSQVEALSWEGELLRDAAGRVVAPPRIEARTGQFGSGGTIAWGPYAPVAATAAEAETGRRDLAAPLVGDVLGWRVTLPYADPGVAAPQADSVARTATLFLLGAWISLAASRWRFDNVAQLVERSEFGRYGAPGGWDGSRDLLLLRVPLDATLRGRRQDGLRARLAVSGSPGLAVLEIQAVVDLGHDPEDE